MVTGSDSGRTRANPSRSDAAARPPFDANHPPERRLIDACVHCGYCLTSCPTYRLWGDEADSPRGRILLMKAGLEGRVTLSRALVSHFDACLGCLACVTACPSGVEYGHLIEAARSQMERRYRRPLLDRLERQLLFELFPHPGRLRFVAAALVIMAPVRDAAERAGLIGRLPRRVAAFARLAPRVRLGDLRQRAPVRVTPSGPARCRVGLFTGCVQRVFHGATNAATARVLAAEGCEIVAPIEQGCCGALAVHAGRPEEARRRARDTIAAFEGADVERIVVNAAGCGSTLKDYGSLLADDPEWVERARAFGAKVRDVMEFMSELGEPRAQRHPIPARAVYQDACHLLHAQGIERAPRAALAQIPGLELVGIDDPGMCCGSGGIYNLLQPEPAEQLGIHKARNIDRAKPDIVLSANPGCRIQLETAARAIGGTWRVAHPIELIDASIRRGRVG